MFILCVAATVLLGCNAQQGSAREIIPSSQAAAENVLSSYPDTFVQNDANIESPEVWNALYSFNWMGSSGDGTPCFEGKPFLQKNNDGSTAAAGIVDINRDGSRQFLMLLWHAPRGIPSVEVFEVQGQRLHCMGGFFAENFPTEHTPLKLAYYLNDTFQSTAIAARHSYYELEVNPASYYVFPKNAQQDCSNAFLCGEFIHFYPQCATTKEEYEKTISEFMHSLTWVADVEFTPSVCYNAYNWVDLSTELRADEINQAFKNSPVTNFETPEQLKKTSEMVAEILYNDAISGS